MNPHYYERNSLDVRLIISQRYDSKHKDCLMVVLCCAEICCRVVNVGRIHSVHVKLVPQTNGHMMHCTYNTETHLLGYTNRSANAV